MKIKMKKSVSSLLYIPKISKNRVYKSYNDHNLIATDKITLHLNC